MLKTEGNLNNEIGVPMTLLRLSGEHEIAVLELGMNHAGEIDYLSALVEPDVVLMTNIGDSHIEHFGSGKRSWRPRARSSTMSSPAPSWSSMGTIPAEHPAGEAPHAFTRVGAGEGWTIGRRGWSATARAI
ncbi:MAG: Mur ligase family protein [Flavonifractor plautii]